MIPWPLHTRAKSRDCEIVSPKQKCPEVVPRHIQNHVWSRILKCNAKSYMTRPSTKCYFNEFLFMQVLTHDKIDKPTVVSVWSAMISWFCVRPTTSKKWFLKTIQVTMKHDPLVPCRNPRRLYIHVALTYSGGPSIVRVWSESGPAPLFPPMRVLEV